MTNTFTIPSGRTQFLDANGNPLAAGKVYFYIPATSTPKDTYQDIAGATPNTNPVTLDSAGEASIMGTGAYRQVVTDSLGNQQWDQVVQLASAASLGVVALAGDTMTGTLVTPSVSVTGGELITTTPTGDAVTTLTSLNVQGTTTSTITREFLAAFGLVSNKRNGAGGSVTPSVALYSGVQGQSGTSDIWALRGVAVQDAASGTYNAIGLEIDINNNVADRGNAAGAAGLAAPVTYGQVITGVGANKSTAALAITGPGTAVWNRGIVATSASVSQVTFQDLTNSTTSIEVQGTHTYGIDFNSGTFSNGAIRVPYTYGIVSRDAGNANNIAMISYNGTLLLGSAGVIIDVNGNVFPHLDNTYQLGQNSNRFTAVWAVNGTIQTSDPTLKTDISPISALPSGAVDALMNAIQPIHFKWKSGGFIKDTVLEDQQVPVTETRTTTIETIEVRDGVPVLVKTIKTEEVPIVDDVPVVDESGAPVIITIPAKDEGVGVDGTIVPAQPERKFPLTHPVPRMKTAQVSVVKQVERAGTRVHWGWDASQVKAAFDGIGMDFGGYVLAEDGTQHLRPDQLVPVLWQAVKALRARVAVLESK